MNLKELNILLLKGGISAEREVSLRTGAAVAKALRSLNYRVTELDVQSKDFKIPDATDVVYICLHGVYGEDGELQERLEQAGLAFTGSGSVASRNAFDKTISKQLFLQHNVRTPQGGVWQSDQALPVPCVLKPVSEGSSVGLCIVKTTDDVVNAKAVARQIGKPMLMEEWVEGREVTVSILGDQALPAIEVTLPEGILDYKHKYTPGMAVHTCPAKFDAATTQKIQQQALAAHRVLGCEVYSRVDIIVNHAGEPVVLEVNTLPGMTETSFIPEAARAVGMEFPQLCEKILALSMEVKR